MGRRKIEIVPITHERNRSVTFLKRKNGLFKKAFELGVLCSVDVAVIIFEERPGHDPKLHQYCSGDIHGIVQRQLQFRGEKDFKGPADFSGGAQHFEQGDDDGGGDDDDDEPIAHPPVRSSKRKAGKMSTTPERASNDEEYVPPGGHRTRSAPRMPHNTASAPIRNARFDPNSSDGPGPSGSLLPVSSDRLSSLRDSGHSISYSAHGHATRHASKRLRGPLDAMDPGRRSRSPMGDGSGMMGPRGMPNDLYLPEGAGQRFGAATSNTRGAYPPGAPPGVGPGPGAGSYGAPHYQPMFPVQGHHGHGHHAQSPPTPSFIPVSGGGGMAFASSNARDAYDERGHAAYDYAGMMNRNGPGYGQHAPQPRSDMFAAFLEADERSRAQQQGGREPGRNGTGLEWPSHDGVSGGPGRDRGILESGPPMTVPVGPNAETWFDIFSNASGQQLGSMPPPSGQGSRVPSRTGSAGGGQQSQRAQSWERSSIPPPSQAPTSTAGPSSMDDLATIFGAETVGVGVAGRGSGSAQGQTQQHTVVDIPAAQQPVDSGTAKAADAEAAKAATAPANGESKEEDSAPSAPSATSSQPAEKAKEDGKKNTPAVGATGPAPANSNANADTEMHDADGDADADADADADGDGEVEMHPPAGKERMREGEGEQCNEGEGK